MTIFIIHKIGHKPPLLSGKQVIVYMRSMYAYCSNHFSGNPTCRLQSVVVEYNYKTTTMNSH
ncbi:MAG: hypothetical protein R3D71_10530 [Rickettsiales bacterium]